MAIDCETTGLDPRRDDIVSVAAVIDPRRAHSDQPATSSLRAAAGAGSSPDAIKVHGLREADVAAGRPIAAVLPELLRFIGGRPLVGYYLDFDIAMLDRHVRRWLGVRLPNPRIEVSALYYERKYGDAPPGTQVDLSFAAMLADLEAPLLDQHDAYSDALMTAMAYVALRDLAERGIRIPRQHIDGPQPHEVG